MISKEGGGAGNGNGNQLGLYACMLAPTPGKGENEKGGKEKGVNDIKQLDKPP